MGMTEQILRWGEIEQRRLSPPDTMFANTGRRIYVIGDIDGGFRPRSNPYDLHAYGRPNPKDPLANELQGVWAQPVKGLDGYTYTIQTGAERWDLVQAETFTQTFAAAAFEYRRGSLHATRRDYAVLDHPVLFTELTVKNDSSKPIEARLIFKAHFDLEDAWFSSLGPRRNNGELLSIESGRLEARAEVLPDAWAVVVGGSRAPDEVRASTRPQNPTGELAYNVRLEAHQSHTWTFGIAIETAGGLSAAHRNLSAWLPQHEQMLIDKVSIYQSLYERGPKLTTPDPAFNAAFALAGANIQALEAETPTLGRYFFAGLEMFPFWFSNDAAYSTPGLLASGFSESVKNHVRNGETFADHGAVPHQVSPAGHVVYPSNAQETAQWVSSVWDVYRWTADLDFLKTHFPAAVRGLFDYTLGKIDPDRDGYPSGPGMVEASGMGEETLDAAAYAWAALLALESMAEVLGEKPVAARARETAAHIASRFDRDWWDASSGLYSMSLDSENRQVQVPHWAVITPLEVGLASPERAAQTLATLRTQYLNRWGVKHTAGGDERVWTLPTATSSRAAYRYGVPDLGYALLQNTINVLEHGSIGMFHELIPEGACFIQLWSAAIFRRGVIEDLLGITVDAGAHMLTVEPRLPVQWEAVQLENLAFGNYVVNISHCSALGSK
jgi:glycogen debranching enzyme